VADQQAPSCPRFLNRDARDFSISDVLDLYASKFRFMRSQPDFASFLWHAKRGLGARRACAASRA
jgi:hypothetical protein